MANFDVREITNTVRSGLEALQKENGVKQTAIEELEAEASYTLRIVQDVIDGMSKQKRLWITNDMSSIIIGKVEPSGTFNRERWQELAVFFEAFSAFIENPLVVVYADEGTPEIAVPPILTASRRGNPPKNWGVVKKEEFSEIVE